MIFIDVPASVLAIALLYNFDHPLIVFGIIGTPWWYVLSRAAEIAYSWMVQNRRPNRD
jgi:hypothetical protein